MSADDSAEEKSHEPTQNRIERARREGDALQSREANATAAYISFYISFLASGAAAVSLATSLHTLLDRPESMSKQLLYGDLRDGLITTSVAAAAGLLLAPALGVFLSLTAQNAFTFAPAKLSMKLVRISPVANAKQKFGADGLVEFLKGTIKLTFIMAAFGALFLHGVERWPSYAAAPPEAALELMRRQCAIFLGLICLFSATVAAIDFPLQRSKYRKKLMMSRDDVKRESKESDGDPAMKQSRFQRAKAIATNRMLLDVPSANVVIVNPTHFAVALIWDGPKSGAPRCIAKGADEMAHRIREIAARAGVPIYSDPPTARAIFSVVDVGREVKRTHYAAVAAAIIFSERARVARRAP